MYWFHWALLSAVFAGLTAVLAKAGVKGIDSNLATAIRKVVILVFAWSIARLPHLEHSNRQDVAVSDIVRPGNRCIKLSVVVAIILAGLFLGEHLSWRHWVGAGLIVTGTIVIAKV